MMKTKVTMFVTVFAAVLFGVGCASTKAAEKPKREEAPIILDKDKPWQSFKGWLPMVFSGDGTKFIYGADGGNHITVWDVKSAKELRQIDISKKLKNTWNDQEWDKIQGLTEDLIKDHKPRAIRSLSVSNDGKTLHMIVGPSQGPGSYKTGWNLETGKELHTHALANTGLLRIAMSPDGKTMAIGIRNGTVYFKDMKTGEVTGKLKAHKDRVWGLAYSSDGKFLATVSRWTDGTVKVWRLSDMKEVVHIPKHADSNYGVAFSPDSSLLATASDGNRVRIWKLPALK